jgi:curli biogenesis system outer membrane secretion channel CsgG
MFKRRRGFLPVGLIVAFLFVLGCAGSSKETKGDEGATPRTLPAYNYSGKKIPIVVMDFETRVPGQGWQVGHGASDMLITALVKTKKYKVYERDRLNALMKEQKLQMSGAVDMSTAVQIGKLVGAKYILTGAVTEFGMATSGAHGGGWFDVGKKHYRATVDVRAVNVQTGEIVFADTGSGALKSSAVSVLGFGGGESYDEKKASESMRMAIDDVMSRIYIELN